MRETTNEPTVDLALTTVRHDGELLVHVRGRLSQATADLLVGCCRSWAADGVRHVVLDLADLATVDGFGVAALLRCRRVLRARAGSIRVVNAPPEAAATLSRTGMYVVVRPAAGQRVPA